MLATSNQLRTLNGGALDFHVDNIAIDCLSIEEDTDTFFFSKHNKNTYIYIL